MVRLRDAPYHFDGPAWSEYHRSRFTLARGDATMTGIDLSKWLASAVGVLMLAGPGAPARAEFITYTETAIGSGSFGGTAFASRLITISMTADSSMIGFDISRRNNETGVSLATITVEGIGTGNTRAVVYAGRDFAEFSPGVFVRQVGFTVDYYNDDGGIPSRDTILGTFVPTPPDYALATALGPVAGSLVNHTAPSVATSNGAFVIDSISGGVTFQSVVPEPSSLALCGVAGLAGLGYAGWRRRCVATA